MFKQAHAFVAVCAALPLMAGCGDDAPAQSVPPRMAYNAPRRLPPPQVPDAFASPAAPASAPDGLETPDALAQNADSAASSASAPDPASSADPRHAAPVKYDDALAQTPDTLADDRPGRAMPTLHSHWLRGAIFNARVVVRVNGLFLGTFSAPQDRDITMKLRSGINTMTLDYQPLAPTASAHLDVLESEHDPPIPPLATFRSPAAQAGPSPVLRHTSQTLTFLAR